MNSRFPSRRRARVAAAVTASALALGGALIATPAFAADSTAITDATLTWGISGEAGGGAFAGGCNFLSAGTGGNTGSSRAWTEADGFYAQQSGNVAILKPDASGALVATTWANKCTTPAGTPVSPMSTTSLSGNVVQLSAGEGTKSADGSVSVSWDGSFTVTFYGGMTYWSAADPQLTLDAAGNGTLTATASGYAASMDDATRFDPIAPTTVTLATFTNGTLSDIGFSATPNYRGVEVTATAPQLRTGANWGAFPQDLVNFHEITGQSSYWYSSGGSRDAAKVASPLGVTFTTETGTPVVTSPEDIDVVVPQPATPETGSFGWAFESQNPVSLGTATQQGQNFVAVGALNNIVVTDTRAGGTQPHTWSISGAVSDFSNGTASFSGGYLGWTPKVVTGSTEVTAGPAVASSHTGGTGLAASSVLAQANGAVSATVGAELSLVIPATTTAGSYTAQLTITALN